MPKHSSPAIDYQRLRKAIERELTSGAERVHLAYRDEVVRTTWNVGRILRSKLGLEDKPSAANARLEPCPFIVIKSYWEEKYGRYLADVFYFGKNLFPNTLRPRGDRQGARAEGYLNGGPTPERIIAEGTFLNQELLDLGLAVPYDGEAKN